ncbi:sodium/proline symporter [Candidatus Undinarchaeota archaeon]
MEDIAIYSTVMTVYLVSLILIGYIASKKFKTSDGFFLGGRSVGPWITSFSFIAAYFSSVIVIGGGGFGYQYGMATLWISALNVLIGCTLAWILLGPRLRKFTTRLDSITVPDFIFKRFGAPFAKSYSAVILSLFLIIYCISVLKGMGNIFEGLMGMNYQTGVIISGLIIAIYVAIGGYLAVVWTSFVQAWIKIIGLLLLTFATLKAVGGFEQAHIKLAAIDPGYVGTPGVWGWAGLISFAFIFSFGAWGMPQLLVRFYSIKDLKTMKLGTVLVTVGALMAFLPFFNGAVSRILLPDLASPDLAIPMLSKMVLSPWLAAIFLAAVVAAGMSAFSSILIVISSSIVKDIYQTSIHKNLPEKVYLAYSRVVSLVVGVIAIIVALNPPAMILVLAAFSWAIVASTCLWPIVLGVWWKGATRWGVLSSMIVGSVFAMAWMAAGNPYGIHGFIPGVALSLLVIVIVSLFTKKPSEKLINKLWK